MTQYEMIKNLFDEKMVNFSERIDRFEHTTNEKLDRFEKTTNEKLDNIYDQTKKTNGRVTTLESKVTDLEKANINHIVTCPQAPRIKNLEDSILANAATKKFVWKAITITGVILGALWAGYQLYSKVK